MPILDGIFLTTCLPSASTGFDTGPPVDTLTDKGRVGTKDPSTNSLLASTGEFVACFPCTPRPTGANLSGAGLLRCFFPFPTDAGVGNLAAVVGECGERWSRPRRKHGDLN
jgi:hypothetical protein